MPGHRRGYAARFWLPRNPLPFSLCPSPFSLSLPLSFVTIRRTMARNTRVFSVRRPACACAFRVYRCIARLHVHGRAFAGRNASTAPGNVTAATVSTAVAMSSLMADVEDGDSTLDASPVAFPNHRGYLISEKRRLSLIRTNALQTCTKVECPLLLFFWKN